MVKAYIVAYIRRTNGNRKLFLEISSFQHNLKQLGGPIGRFSDKISITANEYEGRFN